jgi:glycosyltransferase involved in cell wall biosynthesis
MQDTYNPIDNTNKFNSDRPRQKPRLLHIITKSDIGGAQSNVLDLITAFRPRYEIHLAVGVLGPLSEDVAKLGVTVHLLPRLIHSIKLSEDLACVRDCEALIHRLKPSLIHAHSSKAGVVARIAGWRTAVPTVFTAHGWGFSPGTPKRQRVVAFLVERLLSTISTKIICVSENSRQQALKLGIGNQRILTTVRSGLHNEPVPQANPEIEPPRLIMVARFSKPKDHATLLRAIARLNHPTLQLDLVGSGPLLEQCQALALDLGITHQVNFLGDRRDVLELLQGSQIFILTSHSEGFPISILEAMRCGLPVIASRVNGIPEAVLEGETGLLVPNDPEALAEAIAKLLRSPQMRTAMGTAARQRFESTFTIDRMVNDMQLVYEEIMLRRRVKS